MRHTECLLPRGLLNRFSRASCCLRNPTPIQSAARALSCEDRTLCATLFGTTWRTGFARPDSTTCCLSPRFGSLGFPRPVSTGSLPGIRVGIWSPHLVGEPPSCDGPMGLLDRPRGGPYGARGGSTHGFRCIAAAYLCGSQATRVVKLPKKPATNEF